MGFSERRDTTYDRYFAGGKSLPVCKQWSPQKNNMGKTQPPLLWTKEVPLQRFMSAGYQNYTQLKQTNKSSYASWIWTVNGLKCCHALHSYVGDCLQLWLSSAMTTFSYDYLQLWLPSVMTTFSYDYLQLWLPSAMTTFSYDFQLWLSSRLFHRLKIWRFSG